MRLSNLFSKKRSRKYPIRRDPAGLSLRARCFAQFREGKRPATLSLELDIKKETAFRYFRDFQQKDPNFERFLELVRSYFKKDNPERDSNLELFAGTWGIKKEELETILSQPYGLRRLLGRKIYMPVHAREDHILSKSLELALYFSDFIIKDGGKFEDIYQGLTFLFKMSQELREEEDDEIKEDNERIELLRRIIEIDLENERKGRVKPELLSLEEREIIIKWQMQSMAKRIQINYWSAIGKIMAEGNTIEQAREKMYQDLVVQGNPEAAKGLRLLQDKIHPMGKSTQPPQSSPPQGAQPS